MPTIDKPVPMFCPECGWKVQDKPVSRDDEVRADKRAAQIGLVKAVLVQLDDEIITLTKDNAALRKKCCGGRGVWNQAPEQVDVPCEECTPPLLLARFAALREENENLLTAYETGRAAYSEIEEERDKLRAELVKAYRERLYEAGQTQAAENAMRARFEGPS